MYLIFRVIETHEFKFGRTRNAVRTLAAGECFHSYFEFTQTFTSNACITRKKHGEQVFFFLWKNRNEEKENNFLTLIINM